MPRVLQLQLGVLPAHATGGSSIHATARAALAAAALATAAAAAALASLTAACAATTATAPFFASAAPQFGWEPSHLQRRG
jgi:branched-subunit amino acid permease